MRASLGRVAASPLAGAMSVVTVAFGGPVHAAGLLPWQQPVATTVMQSRSINNPAANDFLRLIFVDRTATVTMLGRDKDRVFMAATPFVLASPAFRPRRPLSLSTVAGLTGGAYSPTKDLAAMRCRLPDPAQSAIVANWPNVFAAVTADFRGFQCDPMPPDPSAENQVFCLAQSYRDRPDQLIVKPLARAIDTGLAMMQLTDTQDQTGATVLDRHYGIGLGFSGLGYSVAGSLDTSLTAAQSLRQSIVTEYLVTNATLKAAGCRCIQVHNYPGRGSDPLDPDYIDERGKIGAGGACVRVSRLGIASTHTRPAQ